MRLFRKHASVLVVDDDASVRMALKTMFEAEGYTDVYDAPDGETAIEIVYKQRPRLIILDYDMPRMNGEAVARCIRLFSPDSRVVLFTGVLQEAPAWADAYFQKPDLEQLLPVAEELERV